MLDILSLDNKVVLMNKETGKWLALRKEGYELIERYINSDEICDDKNINDFVNVIKQKLNTVDNNKKISRKGITLLLTNACNFRCVHCFYGAGSEENLYLEISEKFIDFLKWYKSTGATNICLTGGEPLLHPQIKEIIVLAKEIGYENIDVLTNGSLITDEMAEFLAHYGVNIQVSVDGVDNVFSKMRVGGRYEKVLQGITNFKKYSDRINLSFVPTKINVDSWIDVVELAEKLDINLIHLPFLENAGRATENDLHLNDEEFKAFLIKLINSYYYGEYGNVQIYFIKEMETRLKNNLICCDNRCSALNSNLSINYNNDIFPCSELVNNKFKIANLDELVDYSDIYKNRGLVKLLSFSSKKHIECKDCFYRMYCAGGCRLNAYLNGDIDGKDPNCEYTKLIFDNILSHLVDIY